MLVAEAIIAPVELTPEMSAAEGLLDFFFGGGQKQQQPTSSFGNASNNNPQPPPPRLVVASSGPAFCVRSSRANIFRHTGWQRPEPGFHAGSVFSGPHAVGRPVERYLDARYLSVSKK